MPYAQSDPLHLQVKKLEDMHTVLEHENAALADENFTLTTNNHTLKDETEALKCQVKDLKSELDKSATSQAGQYVLPPIINRAKVAFDANGAPFNMDKPAGDFMTDPYIPGWFAIRAPPHVMLYVMTQRANRERPGVMWWGKFGRVHESN